MLVEISFGIISKKRKKESSRTGSGNENKIGFILSLFFFWHSARMARNSNDNSVFLFSFMGAILVSGHIITSEAWTQDKG